MGLDLASAHAATIIAIMKLSHRSAAERILGRLSPTVPPETSMGRLFGTDGVRGIVNEQLTPELALKLGKAIGTFFGEGSRILIGRDVRLGGDMIFHALAAGLLSCGVKVYYAGYAPTPAIQYAVRKLGYDGGAVITASHNPPPYNGIKVVGPDGIEIPREKEKEIEDIFFEEKFKPVPWKKAAEEVKPEPMVIEVYVKGIVEKVDVERIRQKQFKVVVDPANSVAALTSPRILRELGVKAITVNGHLDPYFPGREPEPTPETLSDTAKIVASLGADLGVGHDGDGDRAIFIDEKGRVHWGDRSAALLIKHLVEHKGKKGKVYTAVSSSTLVEDYLKPLGVEVEWTKVGSVVIAHELVKKGGMCGFEENGGFLYPDHIPVRDGGMTLALMLELLAYENRKLSELFDELPKYYPIKTKIPMPREKAVEAVEKVKEAFKGYRQITIDGVKIIGEGFWILVRPSGTEPVLRIMLEAKTEEQAKKLLEKVLEVIKK